MQIDQLRTFLAVLENESFSRAARSLHVGQSTVSFHIKSLETSLGVRLLDRHGGRVALTPAGRVLRRYAQRIVALADEAALTLQTEECARTGHVSIAGSTIPAEYYLPAILAKYRSRFPGVAVVVQVSDSQGAVHALQSGAADLALVGAKFRDSRLVYSAFTQDEIVLVHAPGLDPAQLPLLLREEGSGTRKAVAKLLAGMARGRAIPLSSSSVAPLQVGSSEAARRCALEGVGVAFVSRKAVEDDLGAGRLELVRLPGLPVARHLYVARLRATTASAPVRALVDLILGKPGTPQR